MRRFVIFLIFVAALLGVSAPVHADQAVPLTPGDTGQAVLQVQYVLRSHGYVIPVDGVYGPRTQRAVIKWQTSNGLLPDGVVGPITLDSLLGAAAASAPAVRVSPPDDLTGGLRGLALAPEGLSNCDEMSFYRQQVGLPDRFDALGWRESNCLNTAANSCCVGYWQNYISSHLSPQSRYAPYIRGWCQVDARGDIVGDDPVTKQRQACVTKVVFDISGFGPWS